MRERALSLHRTHTHTNTQAMPSEEGPGPGSYEISAHDARTWHKAPAPKFGREMQRGGVIGAGAGGGLAFESFLERELMDMPAPDAYDVSLSWTAPSVIKDFGSEVRLPEDQDASCAGASMFCVCMSVRVHAHVFSTPSASVGDLCSNAPRSLAPLDLSSGPCPHGHLSSGDLSSGLVSWTCQVEHVRMNTQPHPPAPRCNAPSRRT